MEGPNKINREDYGSSLFLSDLLRFKPKSSASADDREAPELRLTLGRVIKEGLICFKRKKLKMWGGGGCVGEGNPTPQIQSVLMLSYLSFLALLIEFGIRAGHTVTSTLQKQNYANISGTTGPILIIFLVQNLHIPV